MEDDMAYVQRFKHGLLMAEVWVHLQDAAYH